MPPRSWPGPLAPALLADATWYGTLAAVRDLGSRDVPVILAGSPRLAPARWSRYVTAEVSCPSPKDHARFLAWLEDFGARAPGHVLYPTSDDVAWVIARHRAALAAQYRLYSPAPEALATLLDKGRLTEAARAAGLDVVETWLPEDEAAVERISREAPFPLFVKPRTQLVASEGFKGSRVDRREDLVHIWNAGRMPAEVEHALGPMMAGATRPLISRCHAGSETVFTVDGFVDRSGEMVALGCNKLLQHPRRLGPGIIFEAAPVPAALQTGLQRLLGCAGFFGVYDAEFIAEGGRLMLIDVNPRFYNHMAFEIDRGLPQPWLAYLGAAGEEAALAEAMRTARQNAPGRRAVYVHGLPTALMLAAQVVGGNMSRAELRRWRAWIAESDGSRTDPVRTRDDRAPAWAEIGHQLLNFLRHPRAFLRGLYRDAGRRVVGASQSADPGHACSRSSGSP